MSQPYDEPLPFDQDFHNYLALNKYVDIHDYVWEEDEE